MRRRVGLAGVLLLLSLLVIVYEGVSLSIRHAPSPDTYYSQWGSTEYDVLHYDLNLTVDVDTNHLSGIATIEAAARNRLSTFALDLRGLSVSAVTVNDQPAEYHRDEAKLWITPASAVEAADPFTTRVTYSGNPAYFYSESDPSVAIGWIRYRDGIVVLGEPDGAAGWFPSNNHPSDKAAYTFHLTVPNTYNTIINGVLLDSHADASTITTTWQMDKPMASYLVSLVISPYQVKTALADDIPLHFHYPDYLAATVRQEIARAQAMIPVLSQMFGPYPFESYGGVILDANAASDENIRSDWQTIYGLETQGYTLFFKEGELDENLAVHELAHQWFGNSVSLTDWHDIWLKEGFAQYAEWLWEEHVNGPTTLRDKLLAPGFYDDFLATYENNPPGNPPRNALYNASVYVRGAMTLHALRLKVGDEKFFRLVRTYVEQFRYANASTRDFIRLAEQVASEDLSGFFDTWLYSTQLPGLSELGLE